MHAEVSVNNLIVRYKSTRQQTEQLAQTCKPEDLTPQSMPDASPGKWHLAHTTWFFETFILQSFEAEFRWFNENFCYLFNSYYDSVGSRHARPQRGLLTRPSVQELLDYRANVDQRILKLLAKSPAELGALSNREGFRLDQLLTIGLHHEMQHQELFLTDILHLLSHNPISVSIIERPYQAHSASSIPSVMVSFEGGLVDIGLNDRQGDAPGDAWSNFSYDCEQPCHKVFLPPFKLASELVTNAQWLTFIEDGGYQDPLLWLSDGWSKRQRDEWQAPLYWQCIDGRWHQYGLDGLHPIELSAPVAHISFYEAEAFARWSGKRLPREHEWEIVARDKAIEGVFLESRQWRASASGSAGSPVSDATVAHAKAAINNLYGNVWEWTQSAFLPYPGFNPKQGALGEYNGKFMSNQMVLKGGSCATPRLQMRPSYRNFFYPHQRWQFSGLRLAEDV